MIEENNEFKIVDDFEELEYDLSTIGLLGLFLVFEYDQVYFYSDITDFYCDVNQGFLDSILIKDTMEISDGDTLIVFNVEQTEIVKNIFKDVINAEYRQRFTKGI